MGALMMKLSDFKFLRTHAGSICLCALLVLWCAIAFSLALAEIATVFALIFWILYRYQERILKPQIEPTIYVPLLGYILLCVLSLFWTEVPKESYRGIVKVLKYALIFWMCAEVFQGRRERDRFENVFCLFFAVLVLDGFIQYFTGKDLLRGVALQDASAGARVSASFKSFGLLASYLISTIPYLICLGSKYRGLAACRDSGTSQAGSSGSFWGKITNPRFMSWLAAIASIGGLVLLIWTRSRGAFLSFLVGGVLWMVFTKRFKWLMVAGLIAGGAFLLVPKSMIIHQNAEGQEQSIVERYYLWDRALNVIKAKPLTGTGINTYTAAHAKYDKTRNWRVRDYYAHNGYLQAAAETGIPSILFLLAFFGINFYRSLRHKTGGVAAGADNLLRQGLLIGLANFLVLTCVDTVFHNPQAVTVFWFLLGLQYAYCQGDRNISILDGKP
jgi:O-antigen ligase